ncbi:MAG: class I SAM-dependent methyltransferase [Planctomycetes bacterium]|nr:class I SAM-dependent methyltransferase [Planctomycetota bacterium]MBI3833419.1 class I SAM-dependent methyltransferase [Planctomycetota bacterium]
MNPTEKVRAYYEKEAARYDRHIHLSEKLFFGDGRHWAASQAEGDVLEVAIGTGRNLEFYPKETRVTGIDISPKMIEIARQRALHWGRQVGLQVGDAQALSFADASFDTVVCTLSLCCIPDDRRAVAEMKRVLRPGGRLVLLDHVASDMILIRAVQHLLEPLWVLFHSESLLRHPLKLVREEGFEIEWHQRSKWGIVERVLARKPAS